MNANNTTFYIVDNCNQKIVKHKYPRLLSFSSTFPWMLFNSPTLSSLPGCTVFMRTMTGNSSQVISSHVHQCEHATVYFQNNTRNTNISNTIYITKFRPWMRWRRIGFCHLRFTIGWFIQSLLSILPIIQLQLKYFNTHS